MPITATGMRFSVPRNSSSRAKAGASSVQVATFKTAAPAATALPARAASRGRVGVP